MKLTLTKLIGPCDPPCALLGIEMTDSCGGTYRYIANVGPDDRIEDKLRRIADEIAATRRQRVRPAYKVKSLMPDHCKNAAPHAEATEGRR